MRCPFCAHADTKVIDSRETRGGLSTRRRRECIKCSARFSTYEEVEPFRLMVIKRDGRKEEYDREKIRYGLERALEKRPSHEEKLRRLLGEIDRELCSIQSGKVTSREIGKKIMEKLRATDTVAYIRFASVYKCFGSAKSFENELKKLS